VGGVLHQHHLEAARSARGGPESKELLGLVDRGAAGSEPELATLGGHLPVMVTATRGAWSRVVSSNASAGSVDGRALVPFPGHARWAPTHEVPPQGMQARPAPDPHRPAGTVLDGHLPVQVTTTQGAWAQVVCGNGWTGWVDGRLLIIRA